MRGFMKVALAMAVTEAVLWGVGSWSWFGYHLRRWPWMVDRYTLIFPILLLIAIMIARRWKPARTTFIGAAVAGAAAGFCASFVALLLAQLVTVEDRAKLVNVWDGLGVPGVGSFLVVQVLFALVVAIGWFHGTLASILAVAADRVSERRRLSRAPLGAEER